MFTSRSLLLTVGLAAAGMLVAASGDDSVPPSVAAAIEQTNCTGAMIENTASITIGDNVVDFHSVSCASPDETEGTSDVSRRSLLFGLTSFWYKSPFCFFCGNCQPKPPPPPPKPTNVCNASCKITCNNHAGILPPIREDCAMIEEAITVMAGNIASTFVVDPNHIETLTFGTCSYFFSNLNSKKQLEYCWTSLSSTANAAGAGCFPPHQPFYPEGVCTASGSWLVGAAHS
jgi:hypothetical protein